ncbi:chromate efflux transporter [Paracoccus sp. (in: a-proteobacteria)]|uniref:chromate efflux transporter n=1 Tax=Paracoccus sp. TaxID=267 RepID=UPI003A8A1BF2
MATTITVSRSEAFRVFLKIGLLSFGGPAAQIALMHRILVDERGWLTEKQYLNALSFCILLPGPEAMQLATYAGWRLHGITGGLIAGSLFVLPGAMVIFALAGLYVAFGGVPLVDTLFLGVQAAAVVIVVEALLRVSRRALKSRSQWVIAGLAFVAIFFLGVPFPAIVLAAGLYGAFAARGAVAAVTPQPPEGGLRRTALTIAIGLAVWFLPLILLGLFGGAPILIEIGAFFSRLAVVTFGGAYAVLAYMAQDVVTRLGWLSATEMMDGLGLAETTPGPLILVTQFVGFLAGYKAGGFGLAIGAALVTLWVTFVPCFLWIFAGAPYIERISAQPRLSGALGAITAAVVGVILNLSLWFALHVVFGTVAERRAGPLVLWLPDLASINVVALALIALSGYLLLRRHMGVGWLLAISAGLAFAHDAALS